MKQPIDLAHRFLAVFWTGERSSVTAMNFGDSQRSWRQSKAQGGAPAEPWECRRRKTRARETGGRPVALSEGLNAMVSWTQGSVRNSGLHPGLYSCARFAG
jgi:hypothetical protein